MNFSARGYIWATLTLRDKYEDPRLELEKSSVPYCAHFYPEGKTHGIPWIGCWVKLNAGVDFMENTTFLTTPVLDLGPLRLVARR
jgi:hypothetical protein